MTVYVTNVTLLCYYWTRAVEQCSAPHIEMYIVIISLVIYTGLYHRNLSHINRTWALQETFAVFCPGQVIYYSL